MNVEIIGYAQQVTDGSEVRAERFTARVKGVPGWHVLFDLHLSSGTVERLCFERDPEAVPSPLSSTSLRRVVPSELIEAASDEWILAGDPIVARHAGEGSGRPDAYLADLATNALKLQAVGVRRGRNVRLGELVNKKASQVSDDLAKCRTEGWLAAEGERGKGRALNLAPGPKLIQVWEIDGAPEWLTELKR